jgi:tRNA threonylcarbamoyladenosine biosynthesis protein TsaE
MDLYRLRSEDDVLAIGWEDYLAEGAIVAVEWPERAGSLVPSDAIRIAFTHLDGDEHRRIAFLERKIDLPE